MDSIQNIKQKFGIIGNSANLNIAIEKSIITAPTDISVLVIGESGVGKEFIPKIIHNESKRKHNNYIAVNCGAIPEGTIDSELFGHEKGSFTGATTTRKGYFEVADGGTIFLDEVGELPLSTQTRLLRILETGEFIKVGSSKVEKTNVRVIAATNVKLIDAIKNNKFREDLYYRLNTIQIEIPPLRERKNDIPLLFKKFSLDFSNKYNMPPIELSKEAEDYISNFNWPGNIRQLRNFVEQTCILEKDRLLSLEKMTNILPIESNLIKLKKENKINFEEKELIFKLIFEMKKDLEELKSFTLELANSNSNNVKNPTFNNIDDSSIKQNNYKLLYREKNEFNNNEINQINDNDKIYELDKNNIHRQKKSLSLEDNEKQIIKNALKKFKGKRKLAAEELGISERTLYRKIKNYNL